MNGVTILNSYEYLINMSNIVVSMFLCMGFIAASIVVHVPVNWFREPKPKAKREMTEEQRLAAAERLAKGRSLKHT